VVTAQYFGNAHTSGDAIVHFEKANVVHMGDLVFNRMYPYIDVPAGANVQHWITVLEAAMKHYPSDAICLCGHGKAEFGVEGTQDNLSVFRDHLSSRLEHVEKGIAAGQSKAEIVAMDNMASMLEFTSKTPNRLSSNLGIFYD
jgi:cyclase